MALDASSDGNFKTRNPEEVVRVIENLVSINITKNTDFERKRSAAILENDQMDEVRAYLELFLGVVDISDSLHLTLNPS